MRTSGGKTVPSVNWNRATRGKTPATMAMTSGSEEKSFPQLAHAIIRLDPPGARLNQKTYWLRARISMELLDPATATAM